MDSSIRMLTRAANDSPDREGEGIDPAQFSYSLLSMTKSPEGLDDELLAAYRCWLRVWQATLLELDHTEVVYSDEFTRHDEVGALFYADDCVGLTLLRWVDFSLPQTRDDSYFKVWPEPARQALAADGPDVCICSNLTVAPEWRRTTEGVSVKEILLALSVRRFVETGADVCLGTPRTDRGMHSLGYRLGATPLVEHARLHGVEVDLVAFFRRSMRPASLSPVNGELVNTLWNNVCQEEKVHAVHARRLRRTAQSRA